VSNTYFKFKQFIVHQEHTAMKVCTDACLFGAWVAEDSILQDAKSVLDIGTGTGILSLMLAQATQQASQPALITALEIEISAAKEAASNFEKSPWKNRLQVLHQSLQSYTIAALSNQNKYDVIISNPPFFEGDLHSTNEAKNLAAHSIALPWETLCQHASQLLNNNGVYYCLIPALRAYTMQKYCEANGLYLTQELTVYNSAKQMPFRMLQKFIKGSAPNIIQRSKLYIKDEQNNYTESFTKLLQDYYLYL
jgi:tRNA1Val (adenine37-N6)-methyltransferase